MFPNRNQNRNKTRNENSFRIRVWILYGGLQVLLPNAHLSTYFGLRDFAIPRRSQILNKKNHTAGFELATVARTNVTGGSISATSFVLAGRNRHSFKCGSVAAVSFNLFSACHPERNPLSLFLPLSFSSSSYFFLSLSRKKYLVKNPLHCECPRALLQLQLLDSHFSVNFRLWSALPGISVAADPLTPDVWLAQKLRA